MNSEYIKPNGVVRYCYWNFTGTTFAFKECAARITAKRVTSRWDKSWDRSTGRRVSKFYPGSKVGSMVAYKIDGREWVEV